MDIVKKNENIILNIAKLLEEHKTIETVVLDISKISSFTDYFIIATVNSNTHLKAIISYLQEYLESKDINMLNNINKNNTGGWVLLDCGNFIIHLMEKENREFYELEKLWFEGRLVFHSS